MKNRNIYITAIMLMVIVCNLIWITTGCTNVSDKDAERYIKAVSEFADNVLKFGKDVYGEKHTPLFVDGLNIYNHEPGKWKRNGEEWILSNLASQQNLLRTLDGLTKLTKDRKYRNAAEEAVKYAFENLRTPNGLLYWGGHMAYNAQTEKIVMEQPSHEFKFNFPYYDFLWEVDPAATKQFIESYWGSHILDWSNLDMNRHGKELEKKSEKLWDNEYKGGDVFFVGHGLTFCNAGCDMIYSGIIHHKHTGEDGSLVWAKRMADRYEETRNPNTGMVGYMYSQIKKDRAQEQLGPEFGPNVLEGTLLECKRARRRYAVMGICLLQLSEILGEEENEFKERVIQDLTAYGKYAYNPEDNTFTAIITDGRKVTPEMVKRDGYFGPPAIFKPLEANMLFFWAYAMGFRFSGDDFLWQMARDIAGGGGLGNIGNTPDENTLIDVETECSDPRAVLGLLEIYKKTGRQAFLELAKKVGDNILTESFRDGFFVQIKNNDNAKFDALEPLALLHLSAVISGKAELVPQAWPSDAFFHCPYDGVGRTWDNVVIYGQEGLRELR